MEDRKLERELEVLGAIPCSQTQQEMSDSDKPKSQGHWKVAVKTGDKPDGSTKGPVTMKIFGEKGFKTSPVVPGDGGFEPGKEVEFEVNIS